MKTKRLENSPVNPEKIKLINDLLSDPTVNYLWLKLLSFGTNGGSQKDKEDTFKLYADARDKFLGLPPLISSFDQKPNLKIRAY